MTMSSDDYQLQSTYQYTRRTYKKNCLESQQEVDVSQQTNNNTELVPNTIKNDFPTINTQGCSCTLDTQGDLSNFLHKKCQVITLAQQQLQRLLNETDKIFDDSVNKTWFRIIYNYIQICTQILTQNNGLCACILLVMLTIAFFVGLIFGAATCGYRFRRFNNPILTCVENLFMSDSHLNHQDSYRFIA